MAALNAALLRKRNVRASVCLASFFGLGRFFSSEGVLSSLSLCSCAVLALKKRFDFWVSRRARAFESGTQQATFYFWGF